MSFKNLTIVESYDSDEDMILEDFYIPALSNAVRYDRLAGYFSSTAIAMSAKGMADFIQNEGKMRLITCLQIREADRRAIEKGITKPEEVIEQIIMNEVDMADQIKKDHFNALAWMIAHKNLEIKIAIPFADNGGYFTDKLDKNSIYHQKVGVLYDNDNNVVSFSGSINETGQAWTGNIEEFKVFCSWKSGQDKYASIDARKFEKFWYGKAKNTKIFDLPTAIRERLIEDVPKTITAVIDKIQTDTVIQPKLRDYQYDAVDRWLKNDKCGIFEMATGTGKTLTAISCIKKVLETESKSLIVITCPYTHLITQWEEELKRCNIKSKTAYGTSISWETDMWNSVVHLNDGILKKLIIVTTHATFSNPKFIKMIKSCKVHSFVIADEAHKIGAERSSEGLLNEYNYRLGLSATPKRYFDDEGTKKIFDFFGKIVFEFGLDEAIRRGYLTHYSLFPHVVYMTDEETANYHKFCAKIAIEASKEHPDSDKLLKLSIARSKIVKAAKNKLEKFKEIILKNNKLDHCLVYCVEGQLEDAASILHKTKILFHRFTFNESKQQRKILLDEFDQGEKDVLLAIKCLDEGVDVPSTKMAIILASSHNPIEFVQRRGRILRPYEGKDNAIIHDMIVVPSMLAEDQPYTNTEKSIIKKEIDRLKEFSNSSDNPDYGKRIVRTLINKYRL